MQEGSFLWLKVERVKWGSQFANRVAGGRLGGCWSRWSYPRGEGARNLAKRMIYKGGREVGLESEREKMGKGERKKVMRKKENVKTWVFRIKSRIYTISRFF